MHIFESKIVTLRKPSVCFGCGRIFKAGFKIEKITQSDEGKFSHFTWCMTCRAYWNKYMEQDDFIGQSELKSNDPVGWEEIRICVDPYQERKDNSGNIVNTGGVKGLKLLNGQVVIVDDEMLPLLSQYKWKTLIQHGKTYVQRGHYFQGRHKTTGIHHYVIGYPLNGLVTDHIDGNPLNNKRSNLRFVSSRENSWNRSDQRSGKTSSRYPGVCWSKEKKKWVAKITIKKKQIWLGYFVNELDAWEAYREAAHAER